MSMGTLATVAQQVGGQLVGEDRHFDAVSTDTRSLVRGDLLFALKGPNFDASDFLDQARDLGAAGAVVNRTRDVALPQVEVADTQIALGDFAAAWRSGFDVPLAGITGSNGKTTVKEMIAAILRAVPHAADNDVLLTHGNLNNEIGLPLTLLRLRSHHRAAVIEMGASQPHDIARLAEIASPNVGVVTNIAPAHLEGFGSVNQVAETKSDLLRSLPVDGTAVINRDDDFFEFMAGSSHAQRVVSFGLEAPADYFAENVRVSAGPHGASLQFHLCCPGGGTEVTIPMAGSHNVRNALAAAAVAMSMGAGLEAVRQGLSAMENVGGRLRPLRAATGGTVFDDSYNANPGSVAAAIDFLADLDGTRCLILGDMGELGQESERLHSEMGRRARARGIEQLIAIGPLSRAAAEAFGEQASWYPDVPGFLAAKPAGVITGELVLVKASRSMGLERVVASLVGEGA